MRDGPRRFPQNSSCSAVLRCRLAHGLDFAYGTLTRSGHVFHRVRLSAPCKLHRRSYNPARALTHTVWATARSLATTCAITFVFFSCGYLDVSVPRVRPAHKARCGHRCPRVSPFGHRRVSAHLPLAGAFRSLSRPSSPPRATGIPRAPLFDFPSCRGLHRTRSRAGSAFVLYETLEYIFVQLALAARFSVLFAC